MKFGEGQPTDHGGRPRKAASVTAIIRSKGEAIVDNETEESRAERLAEQLWALAESGDKQAIQYIIDRLDGKPKERIEMAEDRVNRVIYEIVDDGSQSTSKPETGEVHSQ